MKKLSLYTQQPFLDCHLVVSFSHKIIVALIKESLSYNSDFPHAYQVIKYLVIFSFLQLLSENSNWVFHFHGLQHTTILINQLYSGLCSSLCSSLVFSKLLLTSQQSLENKTDIVSTIDPLILLACGYSFTIALVLTNGHIQFFQFASPPWSVKDSIMFTAGTSYGRILSLLAQ